MMLTYEAYELGGVTSDNDFAAAGIDHGLHTTLESANQPVDCRTRSYMDPAVIYQVKKMPIPISPTIAINVSSRG